MGDSKARKKAFNLGQSDDFENNSAKFMFLVNPTSGKASILKKKNLVEQVSKNSNARVLISASEDHAAQSAEEAMLAGEVVVACGGDGLQNVVAQKAVETGGVMSVMPLGRGNDFAASLQIRTAQDTEKAIANGVIHHARYVNVKFSDYSKVSLTCAGVGLLSEAGFRASRLPLLQGKLLYTVAALLSLVRLKRHKYTLSLDGVGQREELLILAGAASEYTGGGIHIAPEAQSDPDRLNILYATTPGRASAVNILVKALSGKHLTHSKVHNRFHEQCRVTSETDNFWASLVYGDGEYLGVLPVSMEIGSKPLRVLVPNALG